MCLSQSLSCQGDLRCGRRRRIREVTRTAAAAPRVVHAVRRILRRRECCQLGLRRLRLLRLEVLSAEAERRVSLVVGDSANKIWE